jgi:hypothetical protein
LMASWQPASSGVLDLRVIRSLANSRVALIF